MQHAPVEDSCPCEDDIAAFCRGALPPQDARVLEAHVARCAACRQLLSALAQVADMVSASGDSISPTLPLSAIGSDLELPIGARFGRYVVRGLLGAGGMGIVYTAYDSELDRKVALKVLGNRRLDASDQAPIRDLLLREAQAMARLAHPNVVAVYDVGSVAERVFIAMELVEGVTLTSWLVAAPRKPSEIIAMFLAAGTGLAAAHSAGLIHRDFKPDNVLIGNDGRVRVTDFGLARLMSREPIAAPDHNNAGTAEPGHAATATQSAVVGTPAYMAPEQYLGRTVDPRADQFSFGVALYEALYGKRPVSPQRLTSDEHVRGQIVIAPPSAGIPTRLRRALLRALRTDPAERYPSMTELLAALAPRSRRRGLAVAGALVVALVVACATAYTIHLRSAAEQRTDLVGRLRGLAPELRTRLRSAHMLPQHDIRPERDEVRSALRDVEGQRATMAGQDEPALIDFVLGEGYQALGDDERALTALEAAWAGGERGPRMDAALGDALAASYERGLDQLEDTVPSARRDAEVHTLEARYRDPAMTHLRAALAARASTPAYLEAMIAFHEHRFAEASQKAHAAFTESPMLYEAGVIEAKAHQRSGRELLAADHSDAAKQEFATARQIYEHVLEIARSDDEARRGYGELVREQAGSLPDSDATRELHRTALTALRDAQRINPDNWQAMLSEAEIYEGQANGAIISSQDPSTYVAQVIALANQARAHGANADQVDLDICQAQWELAVYHGAHGIDPRDEFAQALAGCERAGKLRSDANTAQTLGVVYLAQASYVGAHGGDPMRSFEHSEQSFRTALALEDDPLTHLSLGRMWNALAFYRSNHGENPQHAVDSAVTEYEIAGRRDAIRLDAWAGISDALVARAEFQLQRQEDPRSTLVKAHAALGKAVKEAFGVGGRSRMILAMVDAQSLLDRRADPTDAVARVREHAQELLQRTPQNGFAHRYWSQAELVAARWAISRHNDAESWLTHASEQAARARELDPGDALAWTASAEVEQVRAGTTQGADAAKGRGLAFAERALAIDPRLLRAVQVRDAFTQ